MIIQYEVTNAEALQGFALMAEPGFLEPALMEAANEAGHLFLQGLIDFKFGGSGSHDAVFKDSLSVTVEASLQGVEMRVASTAPHAYYLEYGTKGGYVISTGGKAVVWEDETIREADVREVSGRLAVEGKRAAKYVIHPGIQNPPQPFTKTFENTRGQMENFFYTAIGQRIRQAMRGARFNTFQK